METTSLPNCEYRLEGCQDKASYVAALGAGGDSYACGPCMNATDEPDTFVPMEDLAEFAFRYVRSESK